MRKLVMLPAGTIGQDEIESLISVDNQIQALQRKRDRLADDLLALPVESDRMARAQEV